MRYPLCPRTPRQGFHTCADAVVAPPSRKPRAIDIANRGGLAEGAKVDIRALDAKLRAEILDTLERHLTDRPEIEEGRKKYLPTLGTWQLSVRDHRVWYDVTGDEVTVNMVFYKGRLPTAQALARRRRS